MIVASVYTCSKPRFPGYACHVSGNKQKARKFGSQKGQRFNFQVFRSCAPIFYQGFCPLSSGGVKCVVTTKEKLADGSLRELLKGRL